MPNDLWLRAISDLHTFWSRVSGGWIGGRFGRAPILLLTTTGRKTGRQRTTPLLYYQDGDDLVVIASKGGDPKHPTWYLNLKAQPTVEVQVGRDVTKVTARTATAEERARLWPLVTKMYPQYESYQRRTRREIPVVVLKPSG